MTITISLPEDIEARLKRQAEKHCRSMEEVAVDILRDTLQERFPSLSEIIEGIQSIPPDPDNIRGAQGSLSEALRNAPEAPDFDLESWKGEWATVEAEMEAITRADDIAEGRL